MSDRDSELDIDPTPNTSGPTPAAQMEDFERKLKVRAGASIAVYAIFLIATLSLVMTRQHEQWAAYLLGLLVFAIILMPRQALPAGFRYNKGDKRAVAFVARGARMKNWLAITRFVFFALALFSFFVLPILLGPS
jgi:hypothetical protein